MARNWNRRVPLPPMPIDPAGCRWCLGQAKTCACLPSDAPLHLLLDVRCDDCERVYKTGGTGSERQCWECRAAEAATYQRQSVGERRVTGWLKDRRITSAIERDQREGRLPDAPALDISEKRGGI